MPRLRRSPSSSRTAPVVAAPIRAVPRASFTPLPTTALRQPLAARRGLQARRRRPEAWRGPARARVGQRKAALPDAGPRRCSPGKQATVSAVPPCPRAVVGGQPRAWAARPEPPIQLLSVGAPHPPAAERPRFRPRRLPGPVRPRPVPAPARRPRRVVGREPSRRLLPQCPPHREFQDRARPTRIPRAARLRARPAPGRDPVHWPGSARSLPAPGTDGAARRNQIFSDEVSP
jgi:hypothetical protein